MDEFDKAASGLTDDFDVAASQVVNDQRSAVRSSVYGALQANPDLAARTIKMSRQTGIPAEMVKSNLPEIERNAKIDEYDKLLLNSPVTAKWVLEAFSASWRRLWPPLPRGAGNIRWTHLMRSQCGTARREPRRFSGQT
ncbi:MAG: hypothetical protein H3C57_00675 [Gammaproteobacteria bacterium]|nr:hypothetical protein [Gammaproteobacteria bacterium]